MRLAGPAVPVLWIMAAAALPGCSASGATELTLEVAEARVLCTGLGTHYCLLVRTEPGTDYQFFHDWSEGFDYEPGYRYRLRVSRHHVPDPPADAPSSELRLVRVESKEPSPRLELLERVWQAEADWEASGLVSYTMVQQRECYCAPAALGPVRMVVTRVEESWLSPFESVLSQHYIEDGSEVPWELRGVFLGVQQLFSFIYFAIAIDAHIIEAEFDADAGYPRRVYVDRQAGIADDEVEYVVLSVAAP